MPTTLGEPYSPLWRGSYPHMLKEDYAVWEAFLRQNINLFERIYYDVRVGGVVATDPTLTPAEIKMFYDNTAKRMDAIGETKNELWLIEVADHPGLRAIGQLTTYIALWAEDPKINKPYKGVLVCRSIDADLDRAMKIYGMLVQYAV